MAAYPTFPTNTIPAKDVHFVLSRLLTPKEVCLGRLVSNVWNPSGNFCDPEFQAATIKASTCIQEVQDVKSICNRTRTRRISGILTKILSSSIFREQHDRSQLTAANIQHVKLMNPGEFFDTAIKQGEVQRWIEKVCSKEIPLFMITGYSVVRGLHLSANSEGNRSRTATLDGTAPVSLALHNIGLTLSGPLQSTLQQQQMRRTETGALYPEYNVWAVLYRKVRLETSILTSTLAPTCKGWTVMLKPRGQPEREILIKPQLDAASQCGLMEDLKDDEIGWELFGEDEKDVFLLANQEDISAEDCDDVEDVQT